MTEAERLQILEAFRDAIQADPRIEIGPVTEAIKLTGTEIWINVAGQQAYLGANYKAAMLTAQLSDWWIPRRDGKLTEDDQEWFETRATLGNNWEERELLMFKEERRIRLAQNIQIATIDELKDEQEN
ncbi:hypothetical protein [Rubinisphaera sp. JC750]|uniref:hypothetical protein n=1 Tax=Rubinisphaera sp. JC750 TaxID=2898658 RepID=UPI001F27BE38|nr:hypothetical protein [Rubinisphaera sp. JC750]